MGLFDQFQYDPASSSFSNGIPAWLQALANTPMLPMQTSGFPAATPPTDVSSANRNGTSGVTLPQMDASGFGRDGGPQNPLASLFSGIGDAVGGLGSAVGGMLSGQGQQAAPMQPGAQQAPQGAGGPSIFDRLGAGWMGLGHGGLTSAIGGLATGQRQDPEGLLERAYVQQGISPDMAHAAARNPQAAPTLLGGQAAKQALLAAGAPEAIAQSASINPEVFKAVAPHYLGDQFKIVPFGATAIDNRGKVLFQNESGAAIIDDQTADFMAHQYLAGDTSVMQNLGRGAQGAQNIVKLRSAIARLNGEQGSSAQEQAMRNAEFFGVKAGQRTLGSRQANIEMAATEFGQVVPVVMQASAAVNRTDYPTLNKVIQAYEKGTGDPNIVKFASGVNTLVNLYARAISPSGSPTVSDKDHAREILEKSWSAGQFNAAVGMMQQEIAAALKSPGLVKQDMRDRFVSGTGGAAAPAASTPAGPAQPVVPAQALAQARDAIAKGAPRDAVIKRLRDSGIDPAGL